MDNGGKRWHKEKVKELFPILDLLCGDGNGEVLLYGEPSSFEGDIRVVVPSEFRFSLTITVKITKFKI